MTSAMQMISTGTLTAMTKDRSRSSDSALMTPPMARIGAETSMVQVISTSICTCCTSLVVRVMRDAAPNFETSRSLNALTRWKMPPRTSRPKPMAAFEPKYTAATAKTTCTRVAPSMTIPTCSTYPVSPFATPLSMMSAVSRGRYSDAIDCANWNTTTATSSGQCGLM